MGKVEMIAKGERMLGGVSTYGLLDRKRGGVMIDVFLRWE